MNVASWSVVHVRRRRSRGSAATVGVLVVAALLVACDDGAQAPPTVSAAPSAAVTTAPAGGPGASDATTTGAAPAATPTSVPATTTDALGRTTTATLTGGGEPRAVREGGDVVVSAELGVGDELAVTVEQARWTVLPDGSVTLTDDGDAPRVGGTTPSARDDDGVRRASARAEDDGRTLVVTVAPRAARTTTGATTAAVGSRAGLTLRIAPRALRSATWADGVEGGRSLQVDPTAFGRSGSEAALESVRAELVASGPDATTTVMDHQLRCHAIGAPDKPTWNLEPWRPEVDYLAYLLARCNPT